MVGDLRALVDVLRQEGVHAEVGLVRLEVDLDAEGGSEKGPRSSTW